LLIPEVGGIYSVAGRIPQLIVDMVSTSRGILVPQAGLAHRADQLARDDRIARGNMPNVGVQDFVRKAIGISYGNSSNCAFPRICHNARHWSAQCGVAQIE
jgi:hypothetical protein